MLDDGRSRRVALVVFDLWAGSEFVLELTADLLRSYPETHLGWEDLFFSGIHTHSGPGGIYPSPYFSRMAEPYPAQTGFDLDWAKVVAEVAARAIAGACARLQEAVVAKVHVPFGNHAINRSLRAHVKHPLRRVSEARGNAPRPQVEAAEREAARGKISLFVFKGETGRLLGAFGTVPVHSTTLPKTGVIGSTDLIGTISSRAEEKLMYTNPDVVVALAAGAIGDVDPQPEGMSRDEYILRRQDMPQAKSILEGMASSTASTIVGAMQSELSFTQHLPIRARKARVRIAGAQTSAGFMAEVPLVGASVVAGSELGQGALPSWIYWEGMVAAEEKERGEAHFPKKHRELLAAVAAGFFREGNHGESESLDLSMVQLGDLGLLVGLPGEPTTALSDWLGKELRVLHRDVVVCGVNGGYSGYFVTVEEYRQQHYEGASCIWGRNTAWFLRDQLLGLWSKPGRTDGVLSWRAPLVLPYPEVPNADILERVRADGLALVSAAFPEDARGLSWNSEAGVYHLSPIVIQGGVGIFLVPPQAVSKNAFVTLDRQISVQSLIGRPLNNSLNPDSIVVELKPLTRW